MNKLLLYLFVFLAHSSYAQNRVKIDSVLSVLKDPQQVCKAKCLPDTVEVNAAIYLGAKLYGSVPDTALYYLDRAVSFVNTCLKKQARNTELYGRLELKKAKALNEKGWVYYRISAYDESIACFEQAMVVTQKYFKATRWLKHEAQRIQVYNYGGLGVIYTYRSDYPKALANCFAALRLAETIGNKKGMAANQGNIGNIYSGQGEYAKALQYHLKALAMNEETGDKNGQAVNLGNIGIAYDYLGESEKALEYYFKALHLSEELGDKNDQAIDLASIANLHSFKGKFVEAQEYYLKALALNKEIGNKQGETNVMGNIGIVYVKMRKYAEAEKYLLQFYKMAMELHSLYEIQYAHEYLSALYAQTNRSEKALNEYKLAIQYRDSITNEENTRASLEKEVQFNYDKKAAADSVVHANAQEVKNAEIARQDAEISARKNQQYLLYGGLALVLVFAGFMYNRFRVTSRQKNIIEQKEKETQLQNEIIAQQKHIVEEKHKEITDSINYAERLQRSLLANDKLLNQYLQDYFIYFHPKEAVSGDFYWASTLRNGHFALVVADSTGHGVPGAIMSMMNMNSLKESVKEGWCEADQIMNETRKIIIETLENDGSADGGKDGMDAALLIFDPQKTKAGFSLANNPLWLVRNNTLTEYKPDKMPVGKHDKQGTAFTRNSIDLQKGDVLYVFTDGYADQFGGEKGKKFKYSTLENLLLSLAEKPMAEQKEILHATFQKWKGDLEQIDDVCVMGIRI